MHTNGPMFSKYHKRIYRFGGLVYHIYLGTLLVLVFSVFFRKDPSDPSAMPELLLTITAFALSAIPAVKLEQNLYRIHMTYTCSENTITLNQVGKQYQLDLSMPFFVSKIQIGFHIRYSRPNTFLPFYIFSPIPLNPELWLDYQADNMEKIFQSGAVLLPATENVRKWMWNSLGIQRPIEENKVVYFQSVINQTDR